jgi:translation initiation factor IF-2
VLELKANPEKPARGTVIEAKLDKNRGPVATVLIRNGTLKQGSYFICGEHFGKVRAMLNNRGKRMIVATPSMPVEVYGISGVPMAGDEFIAVPDEKTAKEVIEYRLTQSKKGEGEKRGIVSLDDLFQKIKEGEVKELNLVLKWTCRDPWGDLGFLTSSLPKKSNQDHPLLHGAFRNGCHAGLGFRGDHHRLQCSSQPAGDRACGKGEGGHPVL